MFGSMRIANCGACAALANALSVSPTFIGSGLTRWKVSLRQLGVGQVGDVVHRLGDEVDRHDVRLAALRAGQRGPLRQRVAQPLEQLEVVVGAVDLVHLAGLRVADDDPRAEDQRLGLDALAHEPLGLVLGAVVGVREALPLVEHVLLEDALVLAGDGDRAGVVEAADLDRVGELDHVLRALDVRPLHGLLVGGHVVDGGEVEEVVDRLGEPLDAEPRLGQVAGHGDDAPSSAPSRWTSASILPREPSRTST